MAMRRSPNQPRRQVPTAERRRAKPARSALPRQSEASFQGQVLAVAKLRGWRHYHTHDSRRSAEGFPDLVLVRRPRVIFVELKSDEGKVSDDQQEWLAALAGCRSEVYLWRPTDWDALMRVLQ